MKAFFVLVVMVMGISGSALASYDNLSCEGNGGKDGSSGWTMTLKAVRQTVDEVNGGRPVSFTQSVPYTMVLKKKGTVMLDTVVQVYAPFSNIIYDNETLGGQIFLDQRNNTSFTWNNWNYWMECSWESESN